MQRAPFEIESGARRLKSSGQIRYCAQGQQPPDVFSLHPDPVYIVREVFRGVEIHRIALERKVGVGVPEAYRSDVRLALAHCKIGFEPVYAIAAFLLKTQSLHSRDEQASLDEAQIPPADPFGRQVHIVIVDAVAFVGFAAVLGIEHSEVDVLNLRPGNPEQFRPDFRSFLLALDPEYPVEVGEPFALFHHKVKMNVPHCGLRHLDRARSEDAPERKARINLSDVQKGVHQGCAVLVHYP